MAGYRDVPKKFFEQYVVRRDEETFTGVIEALKSTRGIEELALLDLREKIG